MSVPGRLIALVHVGLQGNWEVPNLSLQCIIYQLAINIRRNVTQGFAPLVPRSASPWAPIGLYLRHERNKNRTVSGKVFFGTA